ncbi:MAG: hypothetical protein ACRD22_19900 [Terriglobia bacterium]
MSGFQDSRSQYLSLALFSRQIIDALLELVRNGNRERLGKALPDAIESLQAATDSKNVALSPVASRIATSYDQIRTIDELFPPAARRQMIQTLENLKAPNLNTDQQRSSAIQAIEFFYKIENRALRDSRQLSFGDSWALRGLWPAN